MSSLIGIALLFAACTTGESSAEHLASWRENRPTRYTWTIERSEPVLGPRRFTVTVADGRPIINGMAEPPAEVQHVPLTVDRLFDILIRAQETADSVSVDWDERFGYPNRIDIDYSDAIDDEVTYRVIRFEVPN